MGSWGFQNPKNTLLAALTLRNEQISYHIALIYIPKTSKQPDLLKTKYNDCCQSEMILIQSIRKCEHENLNNEIESP